MRAAVPKATHAEYVLRLADTSLILAQRLGEWVGHAPALEEDLGLGNLALDMLGQARLLLTHAGQLDGTGRSEDELAFFRDGPQFRNFTLVEQPNGDFAHSLVRQYFIDAWQVPMFQALSGSVDEDLAAIAAKSLREAKYHLRFSSGWLVRLGDGTHESHARTQAAADSLIRFTRE
ncbi:MAG: phenylacetate-CoA oxygenase subunit PaaC, partial [Proteobacteria bacterium]|nr:phenylacetate-CoA oxygenase subunit PaaC [Pseudomonadota bacterium]